MGTLCSKSKSTTVGGHQVLGSADQTVFSRPEDPRRAAAEAAERRQREANTRGVQSKNPTGGRLAAKLEAQKALPRAQDQEQPERLVWD